ncbi:MAG TPA: hypothetical protein VGM49_06525 [Candidatus Limnocylindrales bacterium]|jgi:hypothetical protein
MDRRLPLFALGLVAALAAGCGAGTATTGPNPTVAAGPTAAATVAATQTPAPRSTAPASLTLMVKGDSNVSGTWGTSFGIDCNNPTMTGYDIIFFAQSPDGTAVVLITLQPGSVGVSERAGAGATYVDREFTGAGVTALDPARGGTFDSDVTMVPTPSSNPGTLGTITHVSGSVDCGNNETGTSTVVASGASAEGPVTGPFARFRITCNASAQNGASVNITGVIDTAVPPVYMIVSLPANGNATIFSITDTPNKQHSYKVDPAGTATISATGAHLDADFIEVLAAGVTTPAHVIHLAGDVTCGVLNTA